ncbi:MAG TPA: YihY/virulence factor BrkB family protein [Acidimicrobiales bacterium]|nr:YihY/virulence factor BrkB family protein [Acidimicrobiales bacterium]
MVYKMFDDRAPYLAALVTYYAFVSLFPLLLLFLSITGFVLQSDPHLREKVISAALSNLPDLGTQLERNISGFKGSAGALIVGVLGTLYGALGATQAAQYAFNTMYAVPRNHQPNPLKSRVRSFGLILLLGTGVLVSGAIAVLLSTANDVATDLGVGLRILGYALSLALDFGLFTAAFQLLTAEDLHPRDVMAGGAIAAGGWELLQAFGARFVVHEARHGNAFYGVFGVVLATIAWLYLEALVLMISAEINVVRARRLWPRALLTPFTDRVQLTEADRAAYRSYARAQRFKGFEEVDARFVDGQEDDPPPR